MNKQQCETRLLHLLLACQALTFHGVQVVDGELGEELPTSLQGPTGPRHRASTGWDELHVLHGLEERHIHSLCLDLKTFFHSQTRLVGWYVTRQSPQTSLSVVTSPERQTRQLEAVLQREPALVEPLTGPPLPASAINPEHTRACS